MQTTQIPIEELRRLCTSALKKKGATSEESDTVFTDYLLAEVMGRESHGFVSFGVALSQFPKRGTFQVVRETDSVLEIEGNQDCGHLVARRAIDIAVERVSRSGVFAIAIRNITRFNCPGLIARYAADQGKIAIVLEYGGQNFMVPFPDGLLPALSTNPIGIAIPMAHGPAFVADFATSERAVGYVTLAKMLGQPIPESWGVDKDGKPTCDPNALVATTPFGGHKGFSLALAVEILAGILVGVSVGSKGRLDCRGALVLVIDPTAFGQTAEDFKLQVHQYLTEVTNTPTRSGEPIRYPGQRSAARQREALEHGVIELPTEVFSQLMRQVQDVGKLT